METNLHYLAFDELGITIAVIGTAMAFIVLTWNAVRAIHDWRTLAKKPMSNTLSDHEQRISYLEGCCSEVHGKLENDFDFQQEEKDFNKLMLEAIGQLLRHSIDGNNSAGLEDMDRRINKYLLDRMK